MDVALSFFKYQDETKTKMSGMRSGMLLWQTKIWFHFRFPWSLDNAIEGHLDECEIASLCEM